jgi:DNA-binding NarL/FixJ family response regulator
MGDGAWLLRRDAAANDSAYRLRAGCQTVGHSISCDIPIAAFLSVNEEESTGTSQPTRAGRAAVLSPAEARLLRLLLKGWSEKEVAARLGVSPHTVHNHVKEIYRTMCVQSRAELMAACFSHTGQSASR